MTLIRHPFFNNKKMNINTKKYKLVKDSISYLMYVILKTIVEDNEFANEYLISKTSILDKLLRDDWIRVIDNHINPTNKTLSLFEVEKDSTTI